MRSFLFIGGAGFIGSNIIARLSDQMDCAVFVLEPYGSNVSRLDGLCQNILRGSLCDTNLIESIIVSKHITTVIHLASSLVPGSGYDEYLKEYDAVISPTERLIKLCSRMGVKFVFFSSGGTIYGESDGSSAFKEADPMAPISYYGLSKQMIENHILFEHRVSNLHYLILRPSNPYGPGQNVYGNQGLIAVALGKILSGKSITVWGDGASVRDYIFINDLAEIVSSLLLSNVEDNTINIGSGIGYSVSQVLDIIKTVVAEPVIVEYTKERQSDVSYMVLSNALMNKYIKHHLVDLEEGVRLFYDSLKTRI